MNWSMKRKSSRPSQTSSTRPLPRCPVTKKNLSSNIALKILTQSFTIPFPPAPRIFLANWVEFQARSARIIIPSVATHCPTKQTNKLAAHIFCFFLTFFVNKTSPETEIETPTSSDFFCSYIIIPLPFLTKFFSFHHGKIKKDHGHLMIYFYKIQLCVKKIAKRRKKTFSPSYFDIFFSKKIAKSSPKAPKKESFEAKNGCLTILQKAIHICYILCTK